MNYFYIYTTSHIYLIFYYTNTYYYRKMRHPCNTKYTPLPGMCVGDGLPAS